eukprot:12554861-Ditylum_brightwellii.AAC.1
MKSLWKSEKTKSGFGKNEQQHPHQANLLGITKHSLSEVQMTHSQMKGKLFMKSNTHWSKLTWICSTIPSTTDIAINDGKT